MSRGIAPASINALSRIGRSGLDELGFGGPMARHNCQLSGPIAPGHPVMLRRSIFELIRIWIHLPEAVVGVPTVKSFQRLVQKRVQDSARKAVGS